MSTETPNEQAALSAFVGRQPIFDANEKVFAYELLFRSGTDNFNSAGQGDQVSFTVINNSLSIIGLETLTGGRKAFINVTRQLLLDGDYNVLPKEAVVIELLENIEPEPDVIDACKALKSAGYTLALDDFISAEGYEPLLELADIVKIDFVDTTPEKREALTRQLATHRVKLLAEKVETHDEFDQALRLGYDYYQGYFFSRPQIIEGKDISGVHSNYLRLLAEVNAPDIDFDQLENVVKSDVSLSSKLLRYLNSASFGMSNKITSIKQAMMLLGIRPLKQWASLVTMSHIGKDKPDELMRNSLIRARFCENIADLAGLKGRQFDLFMMGMLSVLDVIMSRPISELIEPMPLAPDVKATLDGQQTPLANLYALTIACEQVNQSKTLELAEQIGLDEEKVRRIYRESVCWTDQVLAA